ncbi:class F sortase [Streptomyces sp. NPDC006997]|uniref:class F sortase n=1 Tax=Streptomyces sp. NPDC006997 TaxID=3155356 RepID=UPI003406A747
MTPLSRRAFALAALTTPLAGCGGPPAGRGARTPPGTRTPAESAPPPRRSAPLRLSIPAIGVDTPVIRLGLAPDGTVEVPPVTAHDRAGWYEHSPAPGQTGPSVILGHVTVGRFGDGVFRHLSALRRGAGVVARLGNGTRAAFTVTSVRTVAKARFPSDDVYGDVGAPELRLITCGGRRTADGYPDNVIVFAALDATGPSS